MALKYSRSGGLYSRILPEVFEITMSLVDEPGPKPDTQLNPDDIATLSELLKNVPAEIDETIAKQRDELYEFDPQFRMQRDQVAALSPQLAAALDRRPDVAVAFWQSFKKLPQWAADSAQSLNWKFIYRVLSRTLVVDESIKTLVCTSDLTDDTPVVKATDLSLKIYATNAASLSQFGTHSARVTRLQNGAAYEGWVTYDPSHEEENPSFKANVQDIIETTLNGSTPISSFFSPNNLPKKESTGESTEDEKIYEKRHRPHALQRRVFPLIVEALEDARPGDYIYVRTSMEERLFGFHQAHFVPPITSALVDTLTSMNASNTLKEVIPFNAEIPQRYNGHTGLNILIDLVRPELGGITGTPRGGGVFGGGFGADNANRRRDRPPRHNIPVLLVDKPNISIFGRTDGLEMQDQAPLLPMPIVWAASGGLLASVDLANSVFVAPNASLKMLDCSAATSFYLSEKSSLTMVDCAIEDGSDEYGDEMTPESEPISDAFLHLPALSRDYHIHLDHVEILGRLRLPQLVSLYQKFLDIPVDAIKKAYEAEQARLEAESLVANREALEVDGLSSSSAAIISEVPSDSVQHLVPPLPSDPVTRADPEYTKHMQFLKAICLLLGNDIFDQTLPPDDAEFAQSIVPNGFGNAIRLKLVQWLGVMQDDAKFVSMTLASLRFVPDQLVFAEAKQTGIVGLLLPLLRRHIDDETVPKFVLAVMSKIARAASVPMLIPLLKSPEMWHYIHVLAGKIQGRIGKVSLKFNPSNISSAAQSASETPISAATASVSSITSDIDKLSLSQSTELKQSTDVYGALKPDSLLPEKERSKLYMDGVTLAALMNAISAVTFSPDLVYRVYSELTDFLLWCTIAFETQAEIMNGILAIFDAPCRILLSRPEYGPEVTKTLVKRGALRPAFQALKSWPLHVESAEATILTAASIAPQETLEYMREVRVKKLSLPNDTRVDSFFPEPQCLPTCSEEDEDGLRLILRALGIRGEATKTRVNIDLNSALALSYLMDYDEEVWNRVRLVFEDELLTTRPKETQNISFIAVIAHLISLSSHSDRLVYLANSGFLQFIEGTNARSIMDGELQLLSLVNLTKCPSVLQEKAILLKSCALHVNTFNAEFMTDWSNTVVDRCKKILNAGVLPDDEAPAAEGDATKDDEDDEDEEVEPSFAEMRAGAKLVLAPGTLPTERFNVSSSGLTIRYDAAEWTSFILELPNDEWLTSGKWCYEVVLNSCGVMQIGWASPEFKHRQEDLLGVGDDQFSCAIDLERLVIWHTPASMAERSKVSDGSNADSSGSGSGEIGRDFISLDDSLEPWSAGSAVMCCVDIDNAEFMWALGGRIRGKLKMESIPEGGLRPAFTFGHGESISFNLGSDKAMVEWKALFHGFTPICEPSEPFSRQQSKERAIDLYNRLTDGFDNEAIMDDNHMFQAIMNGGGGPRLGGAGAMAAANQHAFGNPQLGFGQGLGNPQLGFGQGINPANPGAAAAIGGGGGGAIPQDLAANAANVVANAVAGADQQRGGVLNNLLMRGAHDAVNRGFGAFNGFGGGFGGGGRGGGAGGFRFQPPGDDEEDEEFDPALLADIEVEDDRDNVHFGDFGEDVDFGEEEEEEDDGDGGYSDYDKEF